MIEDRWNLNPGEGAAQLFLGTVTDGMMGGGFLYTNKESISLGVVVGMHAMKADGREIESHQLLERFKELPQIKPLVAGGTVAEYSAHAIPEGGIAKVPRLHGDGYVLAGDAAGLSLNALVTVRGMDFAIASGYHAAQAVLKAKAAGDFSAAGLASYEAGLRQSFVLKDLETARAYPQFMEVAAPVQALPDGGVAPVRGRVHHRARPHPAAHQEGLEGRQARLPQAATLKDAWQARKL